MTQRVFDYKPATLSGQVVVTVGDDRCLVAVGRRQTCIRFADLTSVRLVRMDRRWRTAMLVLSSGGRRITLQCNPGPSAPGGDANMEGFDHACAALLRAIAAARPELRVDVGLGLAPRILVAGLGLAWAALSVLLLAAAAGTSDAASAFHLVTMGGVGVVSSFALVSAFNPFRAVRRRPIGEIASTPA